MKTVSHDAYLMDFHHDYMARDTHEVEFYEFQLMDQPAPHLRISKNHMLLYSPGTRYILWMDE